MRKIIIIFLLFTVAVSCKNEKQKHRIERFVWIRHNQNWINKPSELEARIYLEFLDSSNEIRMSRINKRLNLTEYYIKIAPDSLRELITNNLDQKEFSNCFTIKNFDTPYIYDGDIYCFIFKFENGNERLINYNPNFLPDSLKSFASYMERLANSSFIRKTDPFDRTSLINKYRDQIISCFPPPPPTSDQKVKFRAPDLNKTIKN